MTTYRFGNFEQLRAQITDAEGTPVAVTTREKSGTRFEIHESDGTLLCTGQKPRKLTRRHDLLDATGTSLAVIEAHAPIHQDITLPDGRTWALHGTLTDRTWAMRDGEQVIVESVPVGASKWSLDWQVTCSIDIDLALLVGIVETHHVLEANRPSQAQSQASLDALGRGGLV